jgi:murein DD-endopeptidase MepM/ murein hydrolase activator NlpD
LDVIDRALDRALARTGQILTRHPRTLLATALLSLGGLGATAFSMASADGAAGLDLPVQRVVSEAVPMPALDAQLEALAASEQTLYRSDTTRAGDTVDSLLRRLGVSDAAAARFLRTDPTAQNVLLGSAGKLVQARSGASGVLQELVARYPSDVPEELTQKFKRLSIHRSADGQLHSRIETAPLQVQTRVGSGTISQSLFAATDEARLPDNVASQLAEMFGTEIDFRRDLRRGDTFSVVYEALVADGELVPWGNGAGRVLAADFVNGARRYSAAWYADAQGKGAYFDLNGQSKRRAFLASPLEFSRVTSGFAMRMHPILGIWKQHKGVDFGAPTGTPIRAVGDGVVEFAGWQNGYGNVVTIAHSQGRATTYAHMSRIDVRVGQRIEQGANVGAVGATGWATGPHLHFEFKVNGEQQDPMAIAQSSEAVSIPAGARPAFVQMASEYKSRMDLALATPARGVGRRVVE